MNNLWSLFNIQMLQDYFLFIWQKSKTCGSSDQHSASTSFYWVVFLNKTYFVNNKLLICWDFIIYKIFSDLNFLNFLNHFSSTLFHTMLHDEIVFKNFYDRNDFIYHGGSAPLIHSFYMWFFKFDNYISHSLEVLRK